MNSRISFDLHTHTRYSHGKGSIADNAAMAAGLGLKRLGISDHGPGCLTFGIDLNGVPSMRKDIEKASELYPGLEISLGVEANTANADGSLDISKEDQKLFDYIIAGYHYSYFGKKPFTGLAVVMSGWAHEHGATTSEHARARNTDFIVNSLYENDIYILAHPG
ncbi:MAG: PHP domain-containing protein, partial [Firmicutes bacterium]|nr:PHP domain-containing protein [Bacillota bacterium]